MAGHDADSACQPRGLLSYRSASWAITSWSGEMRRDGNVQRGLATGTVFQFKQPISSG